MRPKAKEETVHLRISGAEKTKYKKAAEDVGLTLSGFFRYSAAKATRLIKTNTDEVL